MSAYDDHLKLWIDGPPPGSDARFALALALAEAAIEEGRPLSLEAPFAPFIPWARIPQNDLRSLLNHTLNLAGVEAPFSIQRPDDESEALLALPGLCRQVAHLAFPDPSERIQWLAGGLTTAGHFQYLDPTHRKRLEAFLLQWLQEARVNAPKSKLAKAQAAIEDYGALWDGDIARMAYAPPEAPPPAAILFTEAKRLDLNDFGILVPLLGSRPDAVLTHLRGVVEDLDSQCRAVEENILERRDLERVHTSDYLDVLLGPDPAPAIIGAYELIDGEGRPNRYDPASATRPFTELVERALLEASGTLLACEEALRGGFCHFLGGGMHHAMAGEGRGFCLMNDIVIALRHLQAKGAIKTAWVIDIDCHKGDGTAHLTLNDPSISTLSIHMAKGWPLVGSPFDSEGHLQPWYAPSTVDIPVPLEGESYYVSRLMAGLDEFYYLAEGETWPDLVIVVGGSDPSELDILQSAMGIRLNLRQCRDRDNLVYNELKRRGIPQAWVMAGGYGPEVWRVHAQFLEGVLKERSEGRDEARDEARSKD